MCVCVREKHRDYGVKERNLRVTHTMLDESEVHSYMIISPFQKVIHSRP
jgi:hypothetical protein